MTVTTCSKQFLVLLLTVALWPGTATAQGGAAEVPANAHVKRYGD